MKTKIYVASSWRNPYFDDCMCKLELIDSFEVYNFKTVPTAFAWSKISPNWKSWTNDEYLAALDHPLAIAGFESDFNALMKADVVIQIQPCGVSAAMEFGYAVGDGALGLIYCPEVREPDLMLKMAHGIYTDFNALIQEILLRCNVVDNSEPAWYAYSTKSERTQQREKDNYKIN